MEREEEIEVEGGGERWRGRRKERGDKDYSFSPPYICTVLLMQTLAGINVPVPNGYICTRRYKSTRCLLAFLSTDLAETCRDCS